LITIRKSIPKYSAAALGGAGRQRANKAKGILGVAHPT